MKHLITFTLILYAVSLRAANIAPLAPAPTGLKTIKVIYPQNTNTDSGLKPLVKDSFIVVDDAVTKITKFKVIYSLAANHTLKANKINGKHTTAMGDTISFDMGADILNAAVTLRDQDAAGVTKDSLVIKLKNNKKAATDSTNVVLTQDDLQQFYKLHYDTLRKTDVGYKGIKDFYTIHIFFDQYGNSLFGSMPTGVQRKYHYMMHIIYPSAQNKLYRYVANVTGGTLTDAIVNWGSNADISAIRDTARKVLQARDVIGKVNTDISEYLFNFFPTSDDLVFTLNFIPVSTKAVPPVPILLKTYTIKKTPFYFGSFDVGVLYTWISNPTYSQMASPTVSGAQALKVTDNKPYVSAALMYTVYFSIVNAIDPKGKYSYWGRSFLDDEGCFLRKIYPALGVGLSGQVFTNWFVGLNCQPMQGFGIFAGRNIRKVNTFDAPTNVDLNNITADQFNYYQNTKTKSDWSIGILLDTSVLTKLIGSISTAATAK